MTKLSGKLCHWSLVYGHLFQFRGEPISHAVNRLDVRGCLRLGLDFFADAANIYIDASGCDTAVVAPDAIEQLITRKNHTGMRAQIVEEPELQSAEIDAAASKCYAMCT